MYLQYGDGWDANPNTQIERRNMQQDQRKRRRNLASTRLHHRQDATPISLSVVPVRDEPVTVDPVTIENTATTYTKPGFVIQQQLTTLTEGDSITVKTQLTYSTIIATGLPESDLSGPESQKDLVSTALITDSLTPTGTPSRLVTYLLKTPASTPQASDTTQNSQDDGSDNNHNPFNPIVIFVLVLVLVLGGAFLITSIFLYRRSTKRKRAEAEANRKSMGKEKSVLLRPDTSGNDSQRAESPLPPLPPASPGPERNGPFLVRIPSELLPSPVVAFPRNSFQRLTPSASGAARPSSSIYEDNDLEYRSEYGTQAMVTSSPKGERDRKASSVFGFHFDQHYSLNGTGSYLQVIESESEGGRTPRQSLEEQRRGIPSPSTNSSKSIQSRNKSFVSIESAIDPDLNYTSNGFRISTQFDDAASTYTITANSNSPGVARKPKGPENYANFNTWSDYDLSRTTASYSTKRSEYDGQSVMSPRLSPLGEDSIWEDALADVDTESGQKTANSSERRMPIT